MDKHQSKATGEPRAGGGGLGGWLIKGSIVTCLFAIVFGLIVMVAGALLADGAHGEGVPPVFAWMGTGACGAFTLGALLGLVGWMMSASTGPSKHTTPLTAREAQELAAKRKEPEPIDHRRRGRD